ncbi:collinsiaV-like protein [Artemisia annua]|uniref:CollinsiaV-like protein n=1 Tax=Artemisia annua TaxID=35608 RepID=A0A2U1MEV0_ARTAN|nr:collinsiaV-like protein [Artemisia annua]
MCFPTSNRVTVQGKTIALEGDDFFWIANGSADFTTIAAKLDAQAIKYRHDAQQPCTHDWILPQVPASFIGCDGTIVWYQKEEIFPKGYKLEEVIIVDMNGTMTRGSRGKISCKIVRYGGGETAVEGFVAGNGCIRDDHFNVTDSRLQKVNSGLIRRGNAIVIIILKVKQVEKSWVAILTDFQKLRCVFPTSNRVTVQGKTIALEGDDFFWTVNGSADFTAISAKLDAQAIKYRHDAQQPCTQDWIHSLKCPPPLSDVMGQVTQRSLDYFVGKECHMMVRGRCWIDFDDLLDAIRRKGNKMNWLRFAITFLFSTETIPQLQSTKLNDSEQRR